MKDTKLGDSMPVNRAKKWGSMDAGDSPMSNEWHGMSPSTEKGSDKWHGMEPSSGHMSDKWVEIDTTGEANPQWNEMKQEKRTDPYSMAPDSGDRPEAPMKKQSSNPMKNSGHGRYEVTGQDGQHGKGL